MGFDPISLLAEGASALGSAGAAAGTAAAGATATTAATAATGLGAAAEAGTVAAGTLAGTTATEAGAAAAAAALGGAASTAGLSSSTLLSLGAVAAPLAARALGPKPPKPGAAPMAPNLFGANKGSLALIGSGVGDANGTFLTGSNKAPNLLGGRKTLLGSSSSTAGAGS